MLTDATAGPLLFSHRGLHVEVAENTLPAYQRAISAGADVLELDVRFSRDREIVVFHDADGSRLAGDPRGVADCTWAELSTWRLRGRDGTPVVGAGGAVCRLEDVLYTFPGVPLNVDLKSSEPALVRAILELIQAHAAWPTVLLTSFSTRTLRRVRRGGYRGPTGLSQMEAAYALLAPRRLADSGRGLPAGQRLQIPVESGPLRLDHRQVIERAHRLGYLVDFWVIDEPAEVERLIDLGADGIVTDNVQGAAEVFAQHARTGGHRARRAEYSAAIRGSLK